MGLEPLATIIHGTGYAMGVRYIAAVPGYAIKKVLSEADLMLDDIKLIEINEAFAAMPLVSTIVVADGDKGETQQLRRKTNVNGGSVAVGHPIGATGARLVMTMLYELRRRGGGYGVAAICGGGCMAASIVIKV